MNTPVCATEMPSLPTSYLSPAERAELIREGDMELLYVAEAGEATAAGDTKASWAWLALTELPAHSLMRLKKSQGAQFIREWGFKTARADALYGVDWLDREESE